MYSISTRSPFGNAVLFDAIPPTSRFRRQRYPLQSSRAFPIGSSRRSPMHLRRPTRPRTSKSKNAPSPAPCMGSTSAALHDERTRVTAVTANAAKTAMEITRPSSSCSSRSTQYVRTTRRVERLERHAAFVGGFDQLVQHGGKAQPRGLARRREQRAVRHAGDTSTSKQRACPPSQMRSMRPRSRTQ